MKGALATGIESAGGCRVSVLGDLSNVDGVAGEQNEPWRSVLLCCGRSELGDDYYFAELGLIEVRRMCRVWSFISDSLNLELCGRSNPFGVWTAF